MSKQTTRLVIASLAATIAIVVACSFSVIPGGGGRGPSATFTIGNVAFTFELGTAGQFEFRVGAAPVRNAAAVPLFDRVPADRPGSGVIGMNVNRVRAVPLDTTKPQTAAQAITGTAAVRVLIADAASTAPCDEGVEIGTFGMTFADGAVSVDDPSLDLTSAALTFAITGQFAICLEVTADVDVRIEIDELTCTFGPAEPAGNANGNMNGTSADGDANQNVGANTNATNANTGGAVNANAEPPPSGFTEAAITHRASEQLVAGPDVDPSIGLQTPAGYGVIDIALSGNGQKVWFVLYDEFPEAGQPQLQLWCVGADGSAGQRSDFSQSDVVDNPLKVSTNSDGSVAIADSGFNSSKMLRAEPGGAATLLLDTSALGVGGCVRGNLRVFDDGSGFLYSDYCGRSFYRVDIDGSPTPDLIVQGADIENERGYTARTFYDFDITPDGNTWYLYVEIYDFDLSTLFLHLVPDSGLTTPTAFEPLPFDTRGIRDVSLTDDGSLLGYCIDPPSLSEPGLCYFQAPGSTDRFEASAGLTTLGAMALADNGSRFYARTSHQSALGTGYGFFQSVGNEARLLVSSQRFSGVATPDFSGLQVSDDGTLLAGAVVGGVYVLHDGVDGLPGFATIDDIYYRYDDAECTLVVRLEVTAPNGVERIFTLPLHDGIEPTLDAPENENPFFNERVGGGVNWSTTFTEVSPGVWERTIDLENSGICKRSFIDETYALRIVLVEANGSRTVLNDFVPFP